MPALALAAMLGTASSSFAAMDDVSCGDFSNVLLASDGVLGMIDTQPAFDFGGGAFGFLHSPSMGLDDSIEAWNVGPHWSFDAHAGGKKFDESGTAPAPGAISLLGLAGLVGGRRRRN